MKDPGLSDEQTTLFNSIAEFARKELSDGAQEDDRLARFPDDKWKKCGARLLQGLCVDKKYGGAGLDAFSTALALEALAYGSRDGGLNFSIAAHLLACVLPIARHGSEEQKQKYLPALCNGDLIACNAMTEAESGSNVFSMNTLAARSKENYLVSGSKTFISNAPVAQITLLYACTDPQKGFHGGISAFIIESDLKGLTRSAAIDKMGLRSCQMGEIHLHDVSVPGAAMLGKEGAGAIIFSESMNWERALLGALHVGTMQQILEMCIDHAGKRKLNGESLASFQAISHRIADIRIKTETARLMVHKAAQTLDAGARTAALNASMAKVYVSDAFNEVCQDALVIFGARGYLTENHIERYLRDATAARIYSGTNDIQKNIIAAWSGL